MAIEVSILNQELVDVNILDQDPIEIEVSAGTTYLSPYLEDIIQKENTVMVIDCGTSIKNV